VLGFSMLPVDFHLTSYMYEIMFWTVTHYYSTISASLYALWWSNNAVLCFKMFASSTMHILTFRTDL
jgi:hypothetical protein